VTEIQIQLAEKSDADAIAEFQKNMAWETEEKKLDMSIVLPAVNAVFEDRQKGFYVVAKSGSKAVASLLITYEWSDWRNSQMWYIQSVYVQTDFRRQGIYRRMYDFILDKAKENHVRFVRLYVETENQRAQSVYENLGMKRQRYFMYQADLDTNG